MRTLAVLFGLLIVVQVASAEWPETMCYAPTDFNPDVWHYPPEESMRADLQLLLDEGFTGVCTYSSQGSLYKIPGIAKDLGFEWVVMGIWCPISELEVMTAIDQAEHVDAYCVGHGGLTDVYDYCEYDTTALAACMDSVRAETGKPVTTTEEHWDYLSGDVLASWLLRNGDWIFPMCHPYWGGYSDTTYAVTYVQMYYDDLCALARKPVIIKESGLPSAECLDCSEDKQRGFWRQLSYTPVEFCYAEAYDQPWKNDPEENAHWGFHDENRVPKSVAVWHQSVYTAVRGASWGRIKSQFR